MLLEVAALYFIISIALRLVFFVMFFDPSYLAKKQEIVKAISIGIRFDIRLAILLILPFILLAVVPSHNILKTRSFRLIARTYFVTSIIVLILFYIIDLGHYEYLGARIDVSALRFLADPFISAQMMWESYPVIKIVGLLIVVVSIFILLYNRVISRALNQKTYEFSKLRVVINSAIFGIFMLIGIWGSLSQYPLRWSNAFFSRNTFVSALGLNPILYFSDTIKNRKIDYDENVVRNYYEVVSKYLGVVDSDSLELKFQRTFSRRMKSEMDLLLLSRPPNIVIIIMESIAKNRLGVSGNAVKPTENLDKLINNALFFNRFYIPRVGTARSVFALITGIPDVALVRTSSRNPLIADQYSIMNAFEDYRKYYIIGGSVSWANIRGLLQFNIQDIEIREQDDFNRPRVDVWGISDLDLFKEAHQIFEQAPPEKPFLAIIQTAGNHPPYTIPEENDGFQVTSVPDSQLALSGFKSLAQFNALRLMDYAIGEFFSYASQASYFDNTIFVLFGDHGASTIPSRHMPPSDYVLHLGSYNVPLIIYAPKILTKPKVIPTVSSLLDILPTLASLAGFEYVNKTLGRDILQESREKENYALILSSRTTGIVSANYFLQMDFDGANLSFHDLNSSTPDQDIQEQHSQDVEHLSRLAKGLYETARYMLYHNRK